MQPEPPPHAPQVAVRAGPGTRTGAHGGPAGAWPFAAPRKLSPEIQRAALHVLRTTARDWGLAASR